jgi:hypothetical protein
MLMMNQIQDIMASIMHDPAPVMDRWNQHNCPACVTRGQSRPDTKARGNHMFRNDGSVVYNCFNCHLKTVWSPGRYVSKDMESLLRSYGASDKEMISIKLIAKEMVESGDYEVQDTAASKLYQKIVQRDLPSDAKPFIEWANMSNIPPEFLKVVNAVNERNPYLLDLDLYWSPSKEFYMFQRFIIPYYMNGQIIGYTARHIDKKSEYRYRNQVSTSIFYNFDLLNDDRMQIILVAEGPIDASLMGGISANNYFLSTSQIELLKKAQERGKMIVIVPDRDKDGLVTIEQAIDNGFSVAMPDYGAVRDGEGIRHIKDFDEACAKYGRLFCLQLLHKSIYTDRFDIRVQTEKWI